MSRATMAALIDRTRLLINDPATGSLTFTDDQIQDALDVHRIERRHVPLRPDPTFQPGGAVLYLDFYSEVPYWEADVLLQSTSWTTLTATTSELLVGHWAFAQQPDGLAVRATGKTYDLYAAAADLCEAWASQVALEFDVDVGSNRYGRSQKYEMLTKQAAKFRAQAQVTTSLMGQDDAMPEYGGAPAVTYPTYSTGDWW